MNYSKSLSFKKALTILLCTFLMSFMFLLTSCCKEPVADVKEMEFPLDDKGYPKNKSFLLGNF